jgi:hypothetical protein
MTDEDSMAPASLHPRTLLLISLEENMFKRYCNSGYASFNITCFFILFFLHWSQAAVLAT